jgi:phosphatidate phosphatase APP1
MGTASIIAALALAAGSPVKTDEEVVFFPTSAWLDRERDRWVVPVHGWIFEPERDSGVRRRLLGELRDALGLEDRPDRAATFERRAWAFLVDNERGKRVAVHLAGETVTMEPSEPNGHFRGTLHLPTVKVKELRLARDGRWVEFRAALPPGDGRTFAGRAQLLGPTGISVISDIDDTIRVTGVGNLGDMLANTFLREYRPVPGMPELYRSWAERGAAVHYVSVAPWQLYGPLAEFIDRHGLPAGSFHLQEFRWKDETFVNLVKSREALKRRSIAPLLEAYPGRRFVLVGDASEKDPEIYGRLAREHPRQIARVLIRHAAGEIDRARFERAFAGVPADRWQVFRRPEEVKPLPPGDAD